MKRAQLIKIINKLKWVALLGIPGTLLDIPHLQLFFLFWFLIFLEPSFWQSLGMVFGNWYAKLIHGSKLPSKDNFTCNGDYILPFKGKWTVFNGGVDKDLSHSWGIVSQRYAYDFIIMDNEGKSLNGDSTKLESYYCYGKEIVAPADGIVVKTANNHIDSRVTGKKVFCDTYDIRGNFILMKHSQDEYSLICHLLPNSLKVKKGDSVRQGEVIGKCGNSGNTSEPHIHFQLQKGRSFFSSAGLPIAFSKINAKNKHNYQLADSRPREGNLQFKKNTIYIGRGLEVENKESNFE